MNKIVAASSFALAIISQSVTSAQAAENLKAHHKADFLQTVDANKDGKASKAEFIAAMEKKFNSMDVDKSEAVSVQELKIYGEKDEEARKKALQTAKQAANLEKMISRKNFFKLFTDRAEREFAALDKNQDNELSADETGAKKSKKKKNQKTIQSKKTMTKAEFVALFTNKAEQVFTKLDKNHDNKLADSELGIKHKPKAKLPLPELPKLASAPKPKNTDKKAKQQALIKSFFVGIDANKDGQISRKEKNTMFEKLFNRLDSNHDQLVTQEEIIAGRHKPLSVQQ